jgi:two-component system, LytTR family, response regulator
MTKENLKTLIIDDEVAARETLKNYVIKYCENINLIGEAIDVPSAVKLIEETKPDLIFLDVEMPFGNAFDVLEQTSHIGYETIFITAFSEYAIQALNYSAAYYILKPVDIDELVKAVNRVAQNRNKPNALTSSKVISENIKNPNNKKIVLPTQSGFDVVAINEIIRLEGSGNYTEIYLTNGQKKVVSKVLRHFQEMLEGNGFIRIHKSHIISLEHITSYHRGRGGSVNMADGSEIEVSPNKKQELLDYFKAQ